MDRDEFYESRLIEAQRRIAELEQERERPVAIPAPPRVPSISPKVSHWLLGIAAVIGAFGGGAGIAKLFQAKGSDDLALLTAQVRDVAEDVKMVKADTRELRDHQRAFTPKDTLRWDIVSGVLCKQNGDKPFAREVDCSAVRFESPPLGKTTIYTDTEWPRVDRAP